MVYLYVKLKTNSSKLIFKLFKKKCYTDKFILPINDEATFLLLDNDVDYRIIVSK